MLKLKWFKWYTVIPIIVVFIFAFVLWVSPYGELSKIKNNQIESIGIAGENKGELTFIFPQEFHQDFAKMLNGAEINMFPTYVGEHKGGGPGFTTRILFTDKSYVDFSYVSLKNKTCIYINGKWYACDENTIKNFRPIMSECKNLIYGRN